MKAKKKLWVVLLILFALIFIGCVYVLISKYLPDKSYKKYKKPESSKSETETEELVDNPIDFAALQKENPDVCGYIKVDGTVVDYPVLRSAEDEPEDMYLNHDWQKNTKFAGAIYIQKMNKADFSDNCTVLYGHNMLDGSMFAGIRKFRNADFFNQNRYITVYTPDSIKKYEIFSAFTYDDRHLLKSFDFNSEGDYEKFIEDSINPQNMFSYNSKPELRPSFKEKDKFIVLSTCTDSYEDMRYLVLGKLIETKKTK